MPYSVVAAGVAVAGGVMAGNRAASDAKKGRALQREQLQFAKDQYQDYKDLYGGVEASLLEEVESYVPGEKLQKYMGEASTDVAMAYDKREGMRTRQMGRLGIDPSQERFQEDVDEVGRERALSEIGARTGARRKSESEDDKQFARRMAMLSTGKEIPGQAGAVMGALQQGSDMYGRSSAQYGKNAASAYGAAGQWAAKAANTDYGGGMSGPSGGDYMGGGYVAPGGSFDSSPSGAGYGDADVDF